MRLLVLARPSLAGPYAAYVDADVTIAAVSDPPAALAQAHRGVWDCLIWLYPQRDQLQTWLRRSDRDPFVLPLIVVVAAQKSDWIKWFANEAQVRQRRRPPGPQSLAALAQTVFYRHYPSSAKSPAQNAAIQALYNLSAPILFLNGSKTVWANAAALETLRLDPNHIWSLKVNLDKLLPLAENRRWHREITECESKKESRIVSSHNRLLRLSPVSAARKKLIMVEWGNAGGESPLGRRQTSPEFLLDLSCVAHDMRSPLQALLSHLETLLDLRTELPSFAIYNLEAVRRQAYMLERMSRAVLQLSRAVVTDADKRVSLAAVLNDVVELHRAQIEEMNAAVEIKPGLPAVYGNSDRLRIIFSNLLDNALKYTAPGEAPLIEIGTVRDRRAPLPALPNDAANLLAAGGYKVIYFKDNGVGIAPEEIARIFRPWHRLRDLNAPGMGLGLAMVKKIVELMDGCIWAHSAPGAGSTFYLLLRTEKPPPTG